MSTNGPALLRRCGLSWSVGSGKWAAGATVALVFAVFYLQGVWQSTEITAARAVTATVLLVIAALGYVVLPGSAMYGPLRTRVIVVGVLVVLWGSQLLVVGAVGVTVLIFPGVVAGLVLSARAAVFIGVALAVVMVVISGLAGSAQWELAVTEIAVVLWMVGFSGNIRLNLQLAQAREELAVAAVSAERVRIGRDLHDILGHSLTAITVKTALARRLATARPEQMLVELDEIEQLARSALRDVRATASAIRETTLAGELAIARSVLTAAGITTDVPSAVDDVVPEGRELFGFVLREAVTNVVRHSRASTCSVHLGRRHIEIRDDGEGIRHADVPVAADGRTAPGEQHGGTGLQGLAERVAAAGGSLVAEALNPRGFRVRAELQESA